MAWFFGALAHIREVTCVRMVRSEYLLPLVFISAIMPARLNSPSVDCATMGSGYVSNLVMSRHRRTLLQQNIIVTGS